MLSGAQVVDVLGRPDGRHGIYAAVAEARSGERLLTILRDGARRDLAAEQYFTDVARAAGLEDFVAPMVTASDGSWGLVQLVPDASLDTLGLHAADDVRSAITRGLERDGLRPDLAAHEARVDLELVASLDAITGHADRHGGNALLDAQSGRLTLVDHELIGGGAYYAADHGGIGLLDPLLPGGARQRPRTRRGRADRRPSRRASRRQHRSPGRRRTRRAGRRARSTCVVARSTAQRRGR